MIFRVVFAREEHQQTPIYSFLDAFDDSRDTSQSKKCPDAHQGDYGVRASIGQDTALELGDKVCSELSQLTCLVSAAGATASPREFFYFCSQQTLPCWQIRIDLVPNPKVFFGLLHYAARSSHCI